MLAISLNSLPISLLSASTKFLWELLRTVLLLRRFEFPIITGFCVVVDDVARMWNDVRSRGIYAVFRVAL